ncbi:MAG TPA: transketolase [Hyphomicrobiaceae bacterium]|nr:transketolase [Hyphomicrobiaceae bacterium]
MSSARVISSGSLAVSHAEMANAIRALAMDAVEKAKSGHPGMPMGMADVATVLFTHFLRYDASDPKWPNRDRFVLSAGHGSMLLYALLYLTGAPDMDIEQLRNFRQLGSKTPGHPEHGHTPGVETTTGPLGQGLANAVGMALAERLWNARLGGEVIDHHTYAVVGDGCLMEGISQEAITLAGHLGLGKLIVLFDDNGVSIDGPTSLTTSEDQLKRFEAAGWNALAIDGHDPQAIAAALAEARRDNGKPWLIACKTIIGYGAPTKQGSAVTHGQPLGADEIGGARERLGWPHGPFEVPGAVLAAWRTAGGRGAEQRAAWSRRWAAVDARVRAQLENPVGEETAKTIRAVLSEAKRKAACETVKRATRHWSEHALEHLLPVVPGLIGGSADLTGSNNTKIKGQHVISRSDFTGSYIHYGVREHGMAAAMNGLALYGGFIPYGGTFLIFTDYCRPAIRLSALMRQRVIYVMTHDSIGLGEDGPTHQPIEHLASLRAIPNLRVLRPADGVETAECWELAMCQADAPSILVLTRQPVPNLRTLHSDENLCAKGGYVLRDTDGNRDVTLVATGSEVGVAIAAADALAKDEIRAAVVSMPSFELFRQQPDAYRSAVLGEAPRIGIEAAAVQGWYEWLRHKDVFIGLSGFGASAPGAKLYEHFGLTPARVAETAKRLIGQPA